MWEKSDRSPHTKTIHCSCSNLDGCSFPTEVQRAFQNLRFFFRHSFQASRSHEFQQNDAIRAPRVTTGGQLLSSATVPRERKHLNAGGLSLRCPFPSRRLDFKITAPTLHSSASRSSATPENRRLRRLFNRPQDPSRTLKMAPMFHLR